MYNVLIADDHAVVRSGLKFLIDQLPDYQSLLKRPPATTPLSAWGTATLISSSWI